MYKRILIVVDAKPESHAALHKGLSLALRHDAEVLLFSVVPRPDAPLIELPPFALVAPPEGQGQARQQAQRRLDEAASRAEREGVMSRSAMGTGEDDARCIVDAARHARCDLIVVACDEGNAVKRLLTGSVVPGLVTASSVPVLVCKLTPPAPARPPLRAPRSPGPAPGPARG